MMIEISRIGDKGLLLEDSIQLDKSALLEEDSSFLEDTSYHVFFKRSGRRIKATGQITTSTSLRCVNCLENFELKINSKFDLNFIPAQLIDRNPTALSNEDMDCIFYEGEQINLSQILVEQINLSIPLKPICSPRCKGICAHCGINLNEDRCNCKKSSDEISTLFNNITR